MDDKIFDFEEILNLFKKKFWIVILITAITTGLAANKASKMQPSYSARLNIFMGVAEEGLDYSIMQQMNFYGRNISTLKDMIMNQEFVEDVLKKKRIDKSASEVISAISVQSSEDSPIVSMSYYGGTTSGGAKILDVMAEAFISEIKELIPEMNPTIVNKAYESISTPNKKKVINAGALFGVIVSIGLILILDYLDDTLKSKQELERVLPIPVLGDIPKHEKDFLKEENYVNSKRNAKINIG